MEARVKQILDLLAAGKTRDQIAEDFGHANHTTIDQYMRRRSWRWSEQLRTYVMSKGHPEYRNHSDTRVVPPRVAQVMSQFSRVDADVKEIAKRLRFNDHHEMARYMKSKGYIWSAEKHNYVLADAVGPNPVKQSVVETKTTDTIDALDKDTQDIVLPAGTLSVADLAQYLPLLQMLYEARGKLTTLLNQTPSHTLTIPRFCAPGPVISKTISIVRGLEQLVRDFSQEKNLPQREILEVALIQFLYRYGYGREVDSLLSTSQVERDTL